MSDFYMRPWRELTEPHPDVRNGTFNQSAFAVDISLIHEGKGRQEYQDPRLYFQRTYITEGMRLLLKSVLKRLSSGGGDPVIQLQTAFGGGKTHTLLAVWHIVTAKCSPSDLPGISDILKEAGLKELPRAKIAVLDGTKLSPNQPAVLNGLHSLQLSTLWGHLAYQLGGEEAYKTIEASDLSGTAPGKTLLADILEKASPCVILMDEVIAYIRQFADKSLTGGTFESNMTFMQNLTEAVKTVPHAILLASLPESVRETGEDLGRKALDTISHLFARVQAVWKPVAKEEAFNIVRRRLFSRVLDTKERDTVCRSFADFYLDNPQDFPQETQQASYYEQLRNAYPIHPEVFARLYEDWSSLPNFQRTRGVLKLMAKIIHTLWQNGNKDPLIMPGNLPLYNSDVRTDIIYYLPVGWDPVVDKDIDGESSQSGQQDTKTTRFGSIEACRRISRTVFLGSASSQSVGGNELNKGIEESVILLGSALPNYSLSIFGDALKRIKEKLYYLNEANGRYWFDTRPNLRREMEERKKRFHFEDCYSFIKENITLQLRGVQFNAVHIFTDHADIPDDENLRLIVLKPDLYSVYGGNESFTPAAKMEEILKNRGTAPRSYQNRLIFLIADYDSTSRLLDNIQSFLAWNSIYEDYQDNKIALDNIQAQQAKENAEKCSETAKHLIPETYKRLFVPAVSPQAQQKIEWDSFLIPQNTKDSFGSALDRVLTENEIAVETWAPIHLKKMLDDYYWANGKTDVPALNVWQDMGKYLYMTRLRHRSDFVRTLWEGEKNGEFWGIAQDKSNEEYIGLCLGSASVQYFDRSTVIIELEKAKHIQKSREEKKREEQRKNDDALKQNGVDNPGISDVHHETNYERDLEKIKAGAAAHPALTEYHAVTRIDPITADISLHDIAKEIIIHLAALDQTDIQITLEINASTTLKTGFTEEIKRILNENAKALNFDVSEFE